MKPAADIYAAVTGADEDVQKSAEARNGLVHVAALLLTKTADGLINPKLALAWLLGALGAPGALIGVLVPVREAGALLPQLALARLVQRSPRRKLVWAAGSAGQGLAAFGVALSAFTLEGAAAGWAILGCLALLAVARSACSLSYKDALARTIEESRRGAITGLAASLASAVVLVYGAALAVGLIPLSVASVSTAILIAGVFWLVGATLFAALLDETPRRGDVKKDEDGASLLAPLLQDRQLILFIATRSLLTSLALAPPFLMMLSAVGEERELGRLGPLLLASGAASIVSSYLWGRLSDRSSRKTLMLAAGSGALILGACAAIGIATGGLLGLAGSVVAVFAAQIAYAGARSGRKIHLTDMAEDANRARYTALSNSVIGVVLLLGGGFGLIAELAGPAWALAALALCSAAALPTAWSLDEVQQDRRDA